MLANVEHGLINELYRLVAAFRPERAGAAKPLTLEDMAILRPL